LPVTDDVEAFQPSSGGGLTPESVDVVVDAGEGSPHHRTDMSEELGLPGVLKNKFYNKRLQRKIPKCVDKKVSRKLQ